jgi:hypothetical protein
MIDATVVDLPLPVGPVQRRDLLHRLGQPQRGEVERLHRDHAQHGGEAAPLAEHVVAEAAHVRQVEGAVVLLQLPELLLLGDPGEVLADVFGVVFRQRGVLDRDQVAVAPHHGRDAHLEVDVGDVVLGGEGEDLVEVHLGHVLASSGRRRL